MPEVVIHYIERTVHGNGIAVKVWGEILTASQEVVNARDLELQTLQVLVLTPLTGKYTIDPHDETVRDTIPWPTKYIWEKGRPDNYATVYLWDDTSTEHTGSVWLDFHALGE